MDDMNRLSQIERFKLGLFKWTSLEREAKRHGLSIQSVNEAPEWNPELQEARIQLGKDAGLLLIDEERRRAWVLADVTLDCFGVAEGLYPDRYGM